MIGRGDHSLKVRMYQCSGGDGRKMKVHARLLNMSHTWYHGVSADLGALKLYSRCGAACLGVSAASVFWFGIHALRG